MLGTEPARQRPKVLEALHVVLVEAPLRGQRLFGKPLEQVLEPSVDAPETQNVPPFLGKGVGAS